MSRFTDITDFDELRRAMAENYEQPEGPARNARAELLLVEAEKLNVPLAVIEALGHQLKVYNYSSEKDKMFVPFARLLRMWDERPEDFDEYEIHSLHWVFKWMSAGMLNQPHIPLASIEKWLGEMEHRYRLAGHSERAVRSAEFSVAAHIGDLARAERAYGAWLAADRDAMADCHACELHGQGWWQARQCEDAEALELWAPVLEGEYTCAHEPHTVLASSLVPLLRLGRPEEARAHHLRGFRLVRAMESMRGAYADHVEFCALTGNEARGLELLAERPAYFTDSGDPRSKLDFMSVVALLMGRLTARGFGDQTVPGPLGRTWTARELASHAREEALSLAALFDERNGTAYVSTHVRERMDRSPLLERLPLGVRSTRTVVPVPAPRPPAAVERREAAAAQDDLPALLAEARRLSASLHPGSVGAWAAVARAAEAEGAELDTWDRAEIVDHEAIGLGPEGRALFERAAELYEEAGDPGEALAARARGANVHALAGYPEAALELISEPYEKILALWADGGTGVRQTASVLVGRARIHVQRMHENHENEDTDAVAPAESAVRELADFCARAEPGRPEDVRLASRAAEARAMLGELAAHGGDAEAAAALFAEAAERYVAAGLPWFAVQYEARLAGVAQHLGDLETAERAARAALEHGGSDLEPVGHAQLHLQLAELLGAGERVEQAAEHALEAAHWADEAGEGPTLGSWARHLLGGFLLRLGRWAEAAEVLESALPDLTAETHGDGAVAQTLWWLGDCHTELGEHREAAERWLRAADVARHWPEQRDHAMLAHLAAEALARAGLAADSDRAYARAVDLWGELGNVHGYVRALRARAWYAAREGREGAKPSAPDEARELMGDAVVGCEAALSDVTGEENRRRIVAELGETYRQFGDLLARSVAEDADLASFRPVFEEALGLVERAVSVYDSLGAEFLDARTAAELAAGWLEADLRRGAAAAGRARGVLSAFTGRDDETAGARRTEAERLLEVAEARSES
ncbi:tetratricopeptide repeat protein [Streptomyces sp. DSM 40750]|uniref:tetratricopeptide repeat protein n=1 Tax=Streptomyces sp. DSM 40750 TaxID=2801030 RepID=UPI00214C416C|nr:tetratricopeptide repeat protein [Streptomyces sp. DSM 40750]UUU25164.1 tetratricopeptide repeat protein [Streptomyces sp. DSM 40750]